MAPSSIEYATTAELTARVLKLTGAAALKRKPSTELFGDDVRLATVVSWKDGAMTFVVTQPQYREEPADERENLPILVRPEGGGSGVRPDISSSTTTPSG